MRTAKHDSGSLMELLFWCLLPLLGAIVLMAALPDRAFSQTREQPNGPICGPHDEVVKALKEKYGEHAISAGMTQNGERMVEMFVSPSGTWTFLITDMQGKACMNAAGDSWTETEKPEAKVQRQKLRELGIQPGGRDA